MCHMRMKFIQPDPPHRTPAWMGLLSALLSLLCFFLPFLEVDSRTFSFDQMYHSMGAGVLSWVILGVLGLAALLCLMGLRGGAAALGLLLVECHVIILGAMCYGVGVKLLLAHLRAEACGCLAGAAGLAANRCFSRLDRRIFAGLLAFWYEVDP